MLIFPPKSMTENANISNENIYLESKRDREEFWNHHAECIDWIKRWNKVLEWNSPYAEWFLGGTLNVSYNCLDRHMNTEIRNKVAFYWEGEEGDEKTITYENLYQEVNKFSNVLKDLGIKKGDRIAIYLPMIPQVIVAMLSCTRIGAIHTVIFGGFSSEAIKDRIQDAEAKMVITSDGSWRKGKLLPLKENIDEALKECPTVTQVIVIQHTNHSINMRKERDFWYEELIEHAASYCPPEEMNSEDLLFILYTSGTTGKPKGIMHGTGGYLLGTTLTTKWVFDVKPSDVFWCTADVGWITGHSYVVYGPLSNGMTQVMYEGSPDYPHYDRIWKIIEKYRVTTFYTAPTLVRTFIKWGESWLQGHDLSSLRLLGVVGESINPDAWNWFYKHVGKEKCPIVDTWWQTETGSIMIAPLPGITPLKPGSATRPLPGIDVKIVNDLGEKSSSGYLVITSPWPSMLRGIYKNPSRYIETYWKNKNYYFTGDYAKEDEDHYFWLMGRVDDVINVSGHRLGTMELESILMMHPLIAEAAVIAVSHEIKGQAIVCFVVIKDNTLINNDLEVTLKEYMTHKIGALAKPERIILIYELPKTRSGKIMRRLLRDIAENRLIGDVTTLTDPLVLNEIKKKYEEEEK